MIVPGHGYLSDEHEVLEYCDMVVIVPGPHTGPHQ